MKYVLADIGMLPYDLAQGDSANVIELDGASVGSLICFDSIYDELARESARAGADIFAVSTNDSWFLDSAALRMHNAHAMLNRERQIHGKSGKHRHIVGDSA